MKETVGPSFSRNSSDEMSGGKCLEERGLGGGCCGLVLTVYRVFLSFLWKISNIHEGKGNNIMKPHVPVSQCYGQSCSPVPFPLAQPPVVLM